MKLDITDINDAFSPTHEISDPTKFVGRYEEIESLVLGLTTDSSFLSIFGLRGIGKSSIAKQIKLIAEGDKTLTKLLSLEYLLPKKGFNYMVHLVSCDEFILDITSLIKRVLLGDDKNESIFSHNKNGDKRVKSFKEGGKANIGGGFMGIKGGIEGSDETTFESIQTDDLVQEFRKALSTTQKDNQKKTGLLILIDEFDILKDKRGFASLVKTCSSKYVKFGIIGIGESTEDLIEDHASIGRQISSVLVKPMNIKELLDIINHAESSIRKEIKFDSDVKKDMVKEAEGFPYFVHLLGKECLLLAFKRQLKVVTEELYCEVKDKLIKGKIQLTQEFRYVEACRTSQERELLLRLFASSDDNKILIEEVYSQAREYGIEKPSSFMHKLTEKGKIEPILVYSRDERHVRFSDPILKVYIKKRESIHEKND
ncbi:hypothetical protein SAMN04488057_11257 [Cyclobacterium lianum]|uniref:AAA ATPase domain-containing protein n=1 Tax=Cyclobacterium lianum TaxID=388280 RepID=A0A1M7PZI6_9BACT|nr:ATP-binding protein [Cyclobacterium lianum]SHN23079.1 hypothetical protein SAMN04488057_11257 [Cyclobacterium lianum]